MNNYGFFIKSLTVAEKLDTEAVTIKFNKDLTIVFGASDIGKTFIYQCIYYMLGSKEEPKRIKEAKKYSRCVLEIESYKGVSYKLKRELSGGNFELFEIHNSKEDKKPEFKGILYIDNNKRKGRTISKFLLELINMEDKNIKINKYGQTQKLFFQNLRQYFLLNEDDVIVKKSHIIGSHSQDDIFKFLITGEDNKESIEVISPTSIREQKRELDLLDKHLKNIKNELEEFGTDTLLDIKSQVERLKIEITNIESKIILLKEELRLISKKNTIYTKKIFCPKCGKELICECNTNILQPVEEIALIENRKKEILERIAELKKILLPLETDFVIYTRKIVRRDLLTERENSIIKEVELLESKIKDDEESIKNIRDKKITKPMIAPIEKLIFEILKKIKFNIKNINFSKKTSDFIINGQERAFYGQGYRAIIYTSFIVAVLKHLRSMNHQIGFMMIDSPLNAYRAKDEKSENLSDNFYNYFKEESSNGSQIIIFENTDVPDEVKDKIEKIDKNGFLAVEKLF